MNLIHPKYFLVVLLQYLLAGITNQTYAQQLEWAQNDGYSVIMDMDAGGNMYSTNGNPYATNHSLIKRNPDGAIMWTFSYSCTVIYPKAITTDSAGHSYIAGIFNGTASFSGNNLTGNGGRDWFICKVNQDGIYQWAKAIGGSADDGLYPAQLDISCDNSGNVYFTSDHTDAIDIDPSATVNTIPASAYKETFVVKLHGSGILDWGKTISGTNAVTAAKCKTDLSGNLVLTGHFADQADLDPGTGDFTVVNTGNSAVFIAKLNSSGTFIWGGADSRNLFDRCPFDRLCQQYPVGGVCLWHSGRRSRIRCCWSGSCRRLQQFISSTRLFRKLQLWICCGFGRQFSRHCS